MTVLHTNTRNDITRSPSVLRSFPHSVATRKKAKQEIPKLISEGKRPHETETFDSIFCILMRAQRQNNNLVYHSRHFKSHFTLRSLRICTHTHHTLHTIEKNRRNNKQLNFKFVIVQHKLYSRKLLVFFQSKRHDFIYFLYKTDRPENSFVCLN